MLPLDLSRLRNAITSLKKAICFKEESKKNFVQDHDDIIRAAVIKNFEFTYELCWKFMARWLEENGAGTAIDGIPMKELFRIAAEQRLIEDPKVWFGFHKARNQTAHTYDDEVAQKVFETVLNFEGEAEKLLKNLEAKNV